MRALLVSLFMLAAPLTVTAEESGRVLNYGIAATLNLPKGQGPFPAVLMLHGLGSTRDEIGNLYVDIAAALAERGIASLRFDFRGFGKSDGDPGGFTLDRQNQDAAIALTALTEDPHIDPDSIGVIGFSFGGGAAIELAAAEPDRIRSLVTLTPVGDYDVDMLDSMGQKVFDRAAEDGIVGHDLGWRSVVLKKAFFDGLYTHDLLAALAAYPGPFLTINGEDDPYGKYAGALLGAAAGRDKRAAVIAGADHVFHIYQPSRSSAPQVIEMVVERFVQTLSGPDTRAKVVARP